MDSHRVDISSLETLLGSRDVATMLGMSREQVWRLFSSGRLPGYRFDRLLRFAPGDVEHFKSEHYQRSGTPTLRTGSNWDLTPGPGRARSTLPDEYHPI